jgi:hypothetical protein
VDAVEEIRALAALERARVLERGATRRLVGRLARALGAVDPPGFAEGTAVTAVRIGLDVVSPRRVALSSHTLRILTRTARFEGRPPEVVHEDPLETILGLDALRLLHRTPPPLRPADVRDPLDRAVVDVATTGRATRREVDDAARELSRTQPGMRQLATAALVYGAAGPARCASSLRPVLRSTLTALAARPKLVAGAKALPLYWLALLVHGTRACLPGSAGRVAALATARLGVLERSPATPQALDRWWTAEAACALGRSPAHWTANLRSLERASGTQTIANVYALLRLDELRRGCSPAWWAPANAQGTSTGTGGSFAAAIVEPGGGAEATGKTK